MDYDPAKVRTAETVVEGSGVSFLETMSIIGGAASEHDALATNPEHFIIIGDIDSGQRGSETFGMFGEPIYMHGIAYDTIPPDLPVVRDETFPVAVFGEMATKDDDTNFHVGAVHQFRPEEDGFVVKPTFIAPEAAPKAVADGHKIHFALEVINSMKIAHAKKQADEAEETSLMQAEPAGNASAVDGAAVDGRWNVQARGQEGVFELHADGDDLTGHVKVMTVDAPILDGKLNGAAFSGVVEAKTPVGQVKAKLTGTVSGDDISGVIKVGIMRTKFTGTRA